MSRFMAYVCQVLLLSGLIGWLFGCAVVPESEGGIVGTGTAVECEDERKRTDAGCVER